MTELAPIELRVLQAVPSAPRRSTVRQVARRADLVIEIEIAVGALRRLSRGGLIAIVDSGGPLRFERTLAGEQALAAAEAA